MSIGKYAVNAPKVARFFFLASLFSVVLAGTALLYFPGLHGPFMMDDWGNIHPSTIDEFKLDKVISAVFANESGKLGRPVSAFSFAMTTLFHGMDPYYFKYQNVMLHLLIGVLFFWLGSRLLAEKFPENEMQRAWLGAGIAALIWLIHPLWVSTALYAVQRMAQLSMLFTILALLGYVIGRQRIDRTPGLGMAIMIGGVAIFGILAVFSKENGALLPIYILAIEIFVFRFRTTAINASRRLYLFHIVFVACPLLLGAIYFFSHIDGFLASYDMREFTLQERLMTEARALWFYIALLILPRISSMSLFHDDFPLSVNMDPITILAVAGIVMLVCIAAISFRRHPVLGLGIAWFLAAHLLESTVFPLELVFEHRNYMAAAGVFLAIGFYTAKLLVYEKTRMVAAITCLLVFPGLASMTYVRAQSWGDAELFYRITLMEHPNSFRALTSIANIELIDGQPELARQHLLEALKISPENPGTLVHLLYTYCHADSIPPALVDKIVDLNRNSRLTANDIVNIGTFSANYFRDACPAVTPDIILNITHSATMNRFAKPDDRYYLLVGYGQALQLLNKHDEAVRAFKEALPLAAHAPPTNRPLGLIGLVHSYIALRSPVEARDRIDQLRELNKHPLISINEQIDQLEELL